MVSDSTSRKPAPVPVPVRGRVGRFQLIERIATGGMAEIYLARETSSLDRLVVIKCILPHLAEQPAFVEMFLQEARYLSRVAHPNVVQVYELGEERGAPYIAMEHVPGVSLRDLMRSAAVAETPLPLGVAVGLMAQAAAGAHAAHELTGPEGQLLGLVHRDISPHNLMVTALGHVKLLDFGIAKATEAATHHTRTGALKGKVHYMSPEQCEQRALDRRSDVFALGVVLWELLTARRLFKRDGDLATMQAITTGERWPAVDFRRELPVEISQLIEDALSVAVDDRPETADVWRRALLAAAERAGLDTSTDGIGTFVEELLGTELARARAHLVDAVEKTRSDRHLTDDERAGEPTLHEGLRRRASDKSPALLSDPGAFAGEPGTSVTAAGSRPVSRLMPAFLALVVVAVGLILYAWQPWRAATSGPPLRLGFAPVIDPEVLRVEMEPLRRYLEETTRRPVALVITRDYEELAEKLVDGELHFGSLPPNLYVETKSRVPGIELIAFKLHDGASGNDGFLVVREDSPITDVKSVAGRTLCYGDESSTTGYKLPRSALRKAGVDPDRHLGGTHRSGNHLQVLRDVLAGRCDVGGVYSGVYQTAPSSGVHTAQLRILAVTGRVPQDAMSAGPKTPIADRDLVRRALLELDPRRDLGTAKLGELERISGFAKGSDEDYASLRRLLQEEAAITSREAEAFPPGDDDDAGPRGAP
ncbi:MAG: phosphate/phosphite/phosphonate ABC transporter substrate-binding protein [Myxococcota bacterium]